MQGWMGIPPGISSISMTCCELVVSVVGLLHTRFGNVLIREGWPTSTSNQISGGIRNTILGRYSTRLVFA